MGDLRRELREELTEYTCPNCAHNFQVKKVSLFLAALHSVRSAIMSLLLKVMSAMLSNTL